jgi:hypothetical protein
MILRWAAVCYAEVGKGWRKVQARDMWILRRVLG